MNQICVWVQDLPYHMRKPIAIGVFALCWLIWKTRNEAYFQCKLPLDRANLVFLMCYSYLIKFWTGLEKNSLKGKLLAGAHLLLLVALEVLHPGQGWGLTIRGIELFFISVEL
ncbi:hypothetical protein BRADI_1g06422v3 [Brachypodium distachyon]|uniref:Uncharacterized protein n=1 Tax=Brachypodium distachyon TaxID=15368 RepID=A0A2K2DI98_BRADI|nr:hypothetical protein BRADI_1g06422v3 [Brachypodium distachyon]